MTDDEDVQAAAAEVLAGAAESARDRQAAALRIAGATYQQIADRLGYANPSGAFKAAERGLDDDTDEQIDQIKRLELRRLDELLLGLWQAARGGNVDATDRVLKIMDRRARLLGLDPNGAAAAPTKGGEDDVTRARRARAERRSRTSS